LALSDACSRATASRIRGRWRLRRGHLYLRLRTSGPGRKLRRRRDRKLQRRHRGLRQQMGHPHATSDQDPQSKRPSQSHGASHPDAIRPRPRYRRDRDDWRSKRGCDGKSGLEFDGHGKAHFGQSPTRGENAMPGEGLEMRISEIAAIAAGVVTVRCLRRQQGIAEHD
jgi:hypothetical protein